MLFSLFKKSKKSDKEEREQAEQLIRQSRVDLSRTMVITFIKVLDRLLQARQVDIDAKNGGLPADNGCDCLIQALEEYILQPSHEGGTLETPSRDVGSRFNRNAYITEESTLNTASLETVYCLLALL